MNGKARQFMKNVIGAVGANVVRLLISVVLTLLLPKLMGQEEYSYWQLYLFYTTYLAYSSLGWCEGFTLKYGGAGYDELDNMRVNLDYVWVPLEELKNITVYPREIEKLLEKHNGVIHFVSSELE